MSNLSQQVVILLGLKASLDAAAKSAIEALKETSVPLDERWDAFTELVSNNIFVKNKSFGDGFVDSPYDVFYMERGSTKKFTSAYEQLLNKDQNYPEPGSDIDLDLWREKVLASGYSSFTYDW